VGYGEIMFYYPRKRTYEYTDKLLKEAGFINAEKGWQIKITENKRIHAVPTGDQHGFYLNIHRDSNMSKKAHNTSQRKNVVRNVVVQLEKLEKPSNTLSALMGSINVDSKGIDKNLLEALNKYNNVIRNVLNDESNVVGAYKLLEGNINGSATKILKLNNDLWGNFLPYNAKGIQYYFSKILEIQGKQDSSITKKAELQKQIFNEFKSYLFSKSDLGMSTNSLDSEIRRLFFGDTSLAQLISKLQEQDVWKNHPFIGKLYFEINKNDLPSVVKINAAQEDVVEQTTLMGAYDLLLNDRSLEGTEYTTRSLMQDLILAAYISGGIQQATQYLKYIPTAYIHTIPFAEKLVGMIDKFDNSEFMQLPTMNSFQWDLPSFVVQYYQHNSDKIKKIPTDDKGAWY